MGRWGCSSVEPVIRQERVLARFLDCDATSWKEQGLQVVVRGALLVR